MRYPSHFWLLHVSMIEHTICSLSLTAHNGTRTCSAVDQCFWCWCVLLRLHDVINVSNVSVVSVLSARCAGRASLSPPAWTNTCEYTPERDLINVFTVTRWELPDGPELGVGPPADLFSLCGGSNTRTKLWHANRGKIRVLRLKFYSVVRSPKPQEPEVPSCGANQNQDSEMFLIYNYRNEENDNNITCFILISLVFKCDDYFLLVTRHQP